MRRRLTQQQCFKVFLKTRQTNKFIQRQSKQQTSLEKDDIALTSFDFFRSNSNVTFFSDKCSIAKIICKEATCILSPALEVVTFVRRRSTIAINCKLIKCYVTFLCHFLFDLQIYKIITKFLQQNYNNTVLRWSSVSVESRINAP